ncbi:unnamed protein product [Ambrosiozyma monospora]|uniref:Unnamed protein product n=1 Tax=Ambrosiozyma monospora TaxID=43982 RepID=A0A9W6YP32_AMBMO|nr:unnamed protein product [Ambrosiozyma monospora]
MATIAYPTYDTDSQLPTHLSSKKKKEALPQTPYPPQPTESQLKDINTNLPQIPLTQQYNQMMPGGIGEPIQQILMAAPQPVKQPTVSMIQRHEMDKQQQQQQPAFLGQGQLQTLQSIPNIEPGLRYEQPRSPSGRPISYLPEPLSFLPQPPPSQHAPSTENLALSTGNAGNLHSGSPSPLAGIIGGIGARGTPPILKPSDIEKTASNITWAEHVSGEGEGKVLSEPKSKSKSKTESSKKKSSERSGITTVAAAAAAASAADYEEVEHDADDVVEFEKYLDSAGSVTWRRSGPADKKSKKKSRGGDDGSDDLKYYLHDSGSEADDDDDGVVNLRTVSPKNKKTAAKLKAIAQAKAKAKSKAKSPPTSKAIHVADVVTLNDDDNIGSPIIPKLPDSGAASIATEVSKIPELPGSDLFATSNTPGSKHGRFHSFFRKGSERRSKALYGTQTAAIFGSDYDAAPTLAHLELDEMGKWNERSAVARKDTMRNGKPLPVKYRDLEEKYVDENAVFDEEALKSVAPLKAARKGTAVGDGGDVSPSRVAKEKAKAKAKADKLRTQQALADGDLDSLDIISTGSGSGHSVASVLASSQVSAGSSVTSASASVANSYVSNLTGTSATYSTTSGSSVLTDDESWRKQWENPDDFTPKDNFVYDAAIQTESERLFELAESKALEQDSEEDDEHYEKYQAWLKKEAEREAELERKVLAFEKLPDDLSYEDRLGGRDKFIKNMRMYNKYISGVPKLKYKGNDHYYVNRKPVHVVRELSPLNDEEQDVIDRAENLAALDRDERRMRGESVSSYSSYEEEEPLYAVPVPAGQRRSASARPGSRRVGRRVSGSASPKMPGLPSETGSSRLASRIPSIGSKGSNPSGSGSRIPSIPGSSQGSGSNYKKIPSLPSTRSSRKSSGGSRVGSGNGASDHGHIPSLPSSKHSDHDRIPSIPSSSQGSNKGRIPSVPVSSDHGHIPNIPDSSEGSNHGRIPSLPSRQINGGTGKGDGPSRKSSGGHAVPGHARRASSGLSRPSIKSKTSIPPPPAKRDLRESVSSKKPRSIISEKPSEIAKNLFSDLPAKRLSGVPTVPKSRPRSRAAAPGHGSRVGSGSGGLGGLDSVGPITHSQIAQPVAFNPQKIPQIPDSETLPSSGSNGPQVIPQIPTGSDAGTDPGAIPQLAPGSDTGTDPAAVPQIPTGSDAGTDPGAIPQLGPGSDTGTDPAVIPQLGSGSDAGTEPAGIPTIPGSEAGSLPSDHAVIPQIPGSEAGSLPSDHAGIPQLPQTNSGSRSASGKGIPQIPKSNSNTNPEAIPSIPSSDSASQPNRRSIAGSVRSFYTDPTKIPELDSIPDDAIPLTASEALKMGLIPENMLEEFRKLLGPENGPNEPPIEAQFADPTIDDALDTPPLPNIPPAEVDHLDTDIDAIPEVDVLPPNAVPVTLKHATVVSLTDEAHGLTNKNKADLMEYLYPRSAVRQGRHPMVMKNHPGVVELKGGARSNKGSGSGSGSKSGGCGPSDSGYCSDESSGSNTPSVTSRDSILDYLQDGDSSVVLPSGIYGNRNGATSTVAGDDYNGSFIIDDDQVQTSLIDRLPEMEGFDKTIINERDESAATLTGVRFSPEKRTSNFVGSRRISNDNAKRAPPSVASSSILVPKRRATTDDVLFDPTQRERIKQKLAKLHSKVSSDPKYQKDKERRDGLKDQLSQLMDMADHMAANDNILGTNTSYPPQRPITPQQQQQNFDDLVILQESGSDGSSNFSSNAPSPRGRNASVPDSLGSFKVPKLTFFKSFIKSMPDVADLLQSQTSTSNSTSTPPTASLADSFPGTPRSAWSRVDRTSRIPVLPASSLGGESSAPGIPFLPASTLGESSASGIPRLPSSTASSGIPQLPSSTASSGYSSTLRPKMPQIPAFRESVGQRSMGYSPSASQYDLSPTATMRSRSRASSIGYVPDYSSYIGPPAPPPGSVASSISMRSSLLPGYESEQQIKRQLIPSERYLQQLQQQQQQQQIPTLPSSSASAIARSNARNMQSQIASPKIPSIPSSLASSTLSASRIPDLPSQNPQEAMIPQLPDMDDYHDYMVSRNATTIIKPPNPYLLNLARDLQDMNMSLDQLLNVISLVAPLFHFVDFTIDFIVSVILISIRTLMSPVDQGSRRSFNKTSELWSTVFALGCKFIFKVLVAMFMGKVCYRIWIFIAATIHNMYSLFRLFKIVS